MPSSLNQPDIKETKSLRVVLASSQHGWHGGEEQARLLADGLRGRGHDVHLFARRGEAFAKRMAAENFPVVELSGRGRSLQSILQARRAIRRLRPDVLHANDPHALTCLAFASLGLNIPARIASRRVIYPLRIGRAERKDPPLERGWGCHCDNRESGPFPRFLIGRLVT